MIHIATAQLAQLSRCAWTRLLVQRTLLSPLAPRSTSTCSFELLLAFVTGESPFGDSTSGDGSLLLNLVCECPEGSNRLKRPRTPFLVFRNSCSTAGADSSDRSDCSLEDMRLVLNRLFHDEVDVDIFLLCSCAAPIHSLAQHQQGQ
jgi:hypothetical protein